jgi:hypothetical protein
MASLMRMDAMDLRQQSIAMKRRMPARIRQVVARRLHSEHLQTAQQCNPGGCGTAAMTG